jgi:hypothetical protein
LDLPAVISTGLLENGRLVVQAFLHRLLHQRNAGTVVFEVRQPRDSQNPNPPFVILPERSLFRTQLIGDRVNDGKCKFTSRP